MGTIVITPTPKQREASKTAFENNITLFGGAVRGGKTYWLILLLWSYAKMYPKSRWAIIRKTEPDLDKTTLVTFNKLLNEGLSIDVDNVNGKTKTVTLINGSQIIFMAESYHSDKELNRFRGLEVNGFGLEELNELQEQTFYKCIERAGSWQGSKGCPTKILSTCNPSKGWVKTLFYDRWKNNTLPNGWAYVPAKITDNPHISEEYKESLKLLPPFEYKVFVEGDWEVTLKTGGEFYKHFDLSRHLCNVEYDSQEPLHISFDFNVNPYITLTIYQIKDNVIYQIDEILNKTPYNNTKQLCQTFAKKYNSHQSTVYVYGDPSGKQQDTRSEQGQNDYTIIFDELKAFRPYKRVSTKAPSLQVRGAWINHLLYHDNEIQIRINESCATSITDFTNLKEAPDGTKHKEKATDINNIRYELYGHTSDSFDYFICEAFKNNFIAYQRGDSENISIFGYLENNSY